MYAANSNELWPVKDTKVNFLKFELTTSEKNQCNDFKAFKQFSANMLVIVLYVGLTYGLNNYRLRLNARKIKKNNRRMMINNRRHEDSAFEA